jgi:hypothetical protein
MSNGFLKGEVEIEDLSRFKPNSWNPNVVPPHVMKSIEHGFESDGWLVSQALLIWGVDSDGVVRDTILDGEHRWRAANNVGLKKGPVVVLDGLSEAEAKAFTIKLNQKRGDWDADGLTRLLADIQSLGEIDFTSTDLGFSDDELAKLLAVDAEIDTPSMPAVTEEDNDANHRADAFSTAGEPASAAGAPASNVRMVQLFLDETSHPPFMEHVKALSESYGTKTVTDTVLECIRRAVSA